MVWLRLTCRPHHMTVGVIYALLHPDNSLFHARRLTTVTAVSLLVVQLCGTVYQLHFVWTCHCLYFVHGWKHFWRQATMPVTVDTFATSAPYKWHSFIHGIIMQNVAISHLACFIAARCNLCHRTERCITWLRVVRLRQLTFASGMGNSNWLTCHWQKHSHWTE